MKCKRVEVDFCLRMHLKTRKVEEDADLGNSNQLTL